MRALAAILILVMGVGLGYGWHEVSPRVLGSAPFCGPKYPGMLRTIPEEEYYPITTPDLRPDFMKEDEEEIEEPTEDYITFADRMAAIDEPSLWQQSQQGVTAFRLASLRYVASFARYRIVRGVFHGETATLYSRFAIFDVDGNLTRHDFQIYELTSEQANLLQEVVYDQVFSLDDEALWHQCETLPTGSSILIDSNWNERYGLYMHPTSMWLEIVEPGRYTSTSQLAPSQGSWLVDLDETLLRVAPAIADGEEPHPWMYVPEEVIFEDY